MPNVLELKVFLLISGDGLCGDGGEYLENWNNSEFFCSPALHVFVSSVGNEILVTIVVYGVGFRVKILFRFFC